LLYYVEVKLKDDKLKQTLAHEGIDMGRKVIYLVRHGHYEVGQFPANPLQLAGSNRLGGSLTDLGREQAYLAGQRLRQVPIDRIHYSTMKRAAETAEIIATEFPGVPLHSSELLWEFYWKILTEAIHSLEGETLAQAKQEKQRIATAFDHYFIPSPTEAEEQEILVCHGNLISYFVRRVLQISAETALAMEAANCGISTVIVEENARLILVNYNDVGHLPIAKQTFIRYIPVSSAALEISSSS
jgi:broad specificity phosphatase PhoE